MHPQRAVPLVLAALLLSACSGIPGVYTVERPGDPGSSANGSTADFDPAAYAAKVWKDDVPAAITAAVPAQELFAQLRDDPQAAQTSHGHSQGAGSPWSYVVSGEATVASVDTSGPSALLVLEQTWAPGTTVSIQVGPAMLGTAVRDSLGTIDFSKFVNQIDFADVSTELNKLVKKEVLADLDPATLKGKKVQFVGSFSYSDPKNVVITPLQLKVVP